MGAVEWHRLAGRQGLPGLGPFFLIATSVALVVGLAMTGRALGEGALEDASQRDDVLALAALFACIALGVALPLHATVRNRRPRTWEAAKRRGSDLRTIGRNLLGVAAVAPASVVLLAEWLPVGLRAGALIAVVAGAGLAYRIGGPDSLTRARISDGLVFVSGPLLRPSLLGRVEAARPVRSAIEWRSSPSGEYLQPTVELLLRGVDARLATRLGDRGAATMLDSDPVDAGRGRIALYLGDDPDRILDVVNGPPRSDLARADRIGT